VCIKNTVVPMKLVYPYLLTLLACLLLSVDNDEDAALARKRTVRTKMTPEPEF